MNFKLLFSKSNDAHPTTFAWVNSLLGLSNLLVSAFCHLWQIRASRLTNTDSLVTCPRDGECDFSQGPALQTHYHLHTLMSLLPDFLGAPFDCTASLSLTSEQYQCCNSRESFQEWTNAQRNQVADCVQQISLTMLIEELPLHHWFQCQADEKNILMSLVVAFYKGVLSDKRPVEETNLRQAITSIFSVLKGREWAMIFKLIDACKDTLKLLHNCFDLLEKKSGL